MCKKKREREREREEEEVVLPYQIMHKPFSVKKDISQFSWKVHNMLNERALKHFILFPSAVSFLSNWL